jgi:hypothetical protein
MENNAITEAPLVPPVVDEAELIGLSSTDTPIIEAEPGEELELPPLGTAQQQGLLRDETVDPPSGQGGANVSLPARPGLQRENSVPTPAPLHLPPPAPPAPPSDSLSLIQLKQLVSEKVEPTPYSFRYEDASSLEDELEEWFSYSVEEQAMLLKTQVSFAHEWGSFNGLVGASYDEGEMEWTKSTSIQHKEFVQSLLGAIKLPDPVSRLKKLEALVYILLGCWHESAGIPIPNKNVEPTIAEGEGSSNEDPVPPSTWEKSGLQVQLIRKNVNLLIECGGLQTMVDVMRSACLRACGVDVEPDAPRDGKEAERREVWCAMTAVYVVLEVARTEEKENSNLAIRSAILGINKPGLIQMLIELIAKLRWDESISLPLTKVCLLTWKSILVCFGGLPQVETAKSLFRDQSLEAADARGQPIITASPLDYHLFRQEISSKYPAYNAPPPLFPLEPENNSILPPLKNHPNKIAGNNVFGSGLGNMNGNNTSIFHQPVHIATPAPSPPPSPAGPGGKGGKKQNYQTNQLFPFLYPPLDESSNNLGGKGSTDLQDLLVGRKWEGSDIPASILEAAELFSKRMRATRAMKQLWEERVLFMKYERGWSGADENTDVDDLSLEPNHGSVKKEAPPVGSTEERLNLVEECYVSYFFSCFQRMLTGYSDEHCHICNRSL